MTVKTYRDLEIYKISYELALKVHKLSLGLPSYELYEEGGQLRRSSKSITANIVEGYGRRIYKSEFIKFLIYAQASCDETVVHLSFIVDNYGSDDKGVFIKSYRELGSKIGRFIKYVEKEWRPGFEKEK